MLASTIGLAGLPLAALLVALLSVCYAYTVYKKKRARKVGLLAMTAVVWCMRGRCFSGARSMALCVQSGQCLSCRVLCLCMAAL